MMMIKATAINAITNQEAFQCRLASCQYSVTHKPRTAAPCYSRSSLCYVITAKVTRVHNIPGISTADQREPISSAVWPLRANQGAPQIHWWNYTAVLKWDTERLRFHTQSHSFTLISCGNSSGVSPVINPSGEIRKNRYRFDL